MTVQPVANMDILRRWLGCFATLLGVFTPAIYCDRWTPWVRWVLTGCVVVVLYVVVVRVR